MPWSIWGISGAYQKPKHEPFEPFAGGDQTPHGQWLTGSIDVPFSACDHGCRVAFVGFVSGLVALLLMAPLARFWPLSSNPKLQHQLAAAVAPARESEDALDEHLKAA